jgi:hypothetical protein
VDTKRTDGVTHDARLDAAARGFDFWEFRHDVVRQRRTGLGAPGRVRRGIT